MKIYGGGGRRVTGRENRVAKPAAPDFSEKQYGEIHLDRRLLFDDTSDALWDEVDENSESFSELSEEVSTEELSTEDLSTEDDEISELLKDEDEPEDETSEELSEVEETETPSRGEAVHRVGALPTSNPPRPSAAKKQKASPAQASKPQQTVYRWVDDDDVVFTSAAQTESDSHAAASGSSRAVPKKRSAKRWPWVVSGIAAFCAFMYCFVVFFPTPYIRKWRDIWIETAMSTMTHQWLATAFFPKSLIDEVTYARYELEQYQKDMVSDKDLVKVTTGGYSGVVRDTTETTANPSVQSSEADPSASEMQTEVTQTTTSKVTASKTTKDTNARWLDPEDPLYLYFPEIEPSTFYDYAVENGDNIWDSDGFLFIDEADRDSKGTSIKTRNGDTVKALDTRNGILIINVTGDGFQGILAIVRNPAQVSLAVSRKYGSTGERIPSLCKNNNAILGMNASGFEDPDGKGNGGQAYGYVMSNGERYHKPERSDWFIIGFDYDNIFYTGKYSKLDRELRDAMEFEPLLINNGAVVCTKNDGWGINPRASIGQCADGSVLMLVINGRSAASMGCRCIDMADILYEYGGVQACTVDGGSSAVMYYNGRVITYPSGANKTEGRQLPDAWVVSKVS